jgi:phosphinothricin acetyltransferase
MSRPEIRLARLEDLPAIVAIYNSTIAGRMVTADLDPISVESRLPWFHAHQPERRPLWVCEQGGQLVAWVSLSDFYGRPAYNGTAEVSIYLDETVRGQGLGKALLQYVLETAPQYGVHTLLGFIFGHNVPSLKLFERFGFQRWAHLPEVALLDDSARDLVILGRKLAAA